MTCRLCGARIGILERWRYGDFCSREHKEEFAFENERLAEEILRDLRRPGAPAEPVPIARGAAPDLAPEPVAAVVEEPEPEAAGPVPQKDASPLRPPAAAAKKEEPPKTKPGWKEFASLANLDRVPASAAKIKTPSGRVLWIEERASGQELESGTFARSRKRTLGLPHTHYRRRRPALRLLDQLLPLEPPAEEIRTGVPVDPALWEGWPADGNAGWTAAPDDASRPDIGDVLEEYPLTAPWERWERWPVAEPASLQPARGPQAPRPLPAAAGKAQPRPGAPAPIHPAARRMGMPMPELTTPGAGRNVVAPRVAAGRQPRIPAPPPSPSGSVGLGGIPGLSLPSFPGLAPAGPRMAADYRAAAGAPFSGVWREMAPPMFLAQADPAAGLDPLDRPSRIWPLVNAFAHTRPRIFRPRPRLTPPPTRVPDPQRRPAIPVHLADAWTPKPPEPVRWRP